MADRRWRGAVFDVFIAGLLSLSVYGLALWAAIPLTAWGKKLLRGIGVL